MGAMITCFGDLGRNDLASFDLRLKMLIAETIIKIESRFMGVHFTQRHFCRRSVLYTCLDIKRNSSVVLHIDISQARLAL